MRRRLLNTFTKIIKSVIIVKTDEFAILRIRLDHLSLNWRRDHLIELVFVISQYRFN